MLLLSVQYSETAINVNIFMCGGLAYSHTVLLIFNVLRCSLVEVNSFHSRVVLMTHY